MYCCCTYISFCLYTKPPRCSLNSKSITNIQVWYLSFCIGFPITTFFITMVACGRFYRLSRKDVIRQDDEALCPKFHQSDDNSVSMMHQLLHLAPHLRHRHLEVKPALCIQDCSQTKGIATRRRCRDPIIIQSCHMVLKCLKLPITRLFVEQHVQANIIENINAAHYWSFVTRIDQWLVDSTYYGPVMGKVFQYRHAIVGCWKKTSPACRLNRLDSKPLAACRKPAGSYNRLREMLYVVLT